MLLLSLFLTSMPTKPEMALRFRDITIKQALGTARLVDLGDLAQSLPESLKNGRIKKLDVEVRVHWVRIIVDGVHIQADPPLRDQPLQSLQLLLHRRSGHYHAKAYALGGYIELDGILPDTKKK